MIEVILLLSMLFCHIVDDYYLQGFLASAKQRSWWEKNYPDSLYKKDYLIALIEHAFSWTFMVHLPIIITMLVNKTYINVWLFFLLFIGNWIIHAVTDNVKANKKKINLIQDQMIHIVQIIITWIIYLIV